MIICRHATKTESIPQSVPTARESRVPAIIRAIDPDQVEPDITESDIEIGTAGRTQIAVRYSTGIIREVREITVEHDRMIGVARRHILISVDGITRKFGQDHC
jgi:hypothetical protein